MILIDVDGTLIDSVPDLAFCVDQLMAEMNMPPRGETAVRHWVGNGVDRLVKRALINRLDGEPDEILFKRALPIFLDIYAHNNGKRSCLFAGVKEGMAWLHAAGFRLGAVTNKPARFTQPLLAQMGLLDHFEIVLSGDSLPKKKPDPLPLLHAAKALGVSPTRAMMLGDSQNDVIAARAAAFQIVCVDYGYNHGQDIRHSKPDAVIRSMTELEILLTQAA